MKLARSGKTTGGDGDGGLDQTLGDEAMMHAATHQASLEGPPWYRTFSIVAGEFVRGGRINVSTIARAVEVSPRRDRVQAWASEAY